MKSRSYKILLSLVLLLVMFLAGCSETEHNPTELTQPNSATEETREEVSQDNTETVLHEDGSITITTTDSQGNIVTQIIYSASTNTTDKLTYEYDEQGNLIHELTYSADGNVVEEFAANNYKNANGFRERNPGVFGDFGIALEEPFSVTVEELAPLYEKAEQLWARYGVVVLIADKVSDFTVGAELCLEYEKIDACLNLVESCLSCYPVDFFRDFSGVVCIQLVGTGASAGQYTGGYQCKLIQIDVNDYSPESGYDDKGYFFCYTLQHEIAHMISDVLMKRAEGSQCPLTEERWNSFNPEGFAYVNNTYADEMASERYCSGDNYQYFISSYGCSTPEEDRATIFGEAMAYSQGYNVSVNDPVKQKLIYFGNCIKAGFPNIHWGDMAPWEHILQREN